MSGYPATTTPRSPSSRDVPDPSVRDVGGVRYQVAMDYRPGDVANGHILGQDGQWHLVADRSEAEDFVPQRTSAGGAKGGDTYGARYKRRWRWSALVLAGLGAISVLARGGTVVDLVLVSVLDASVFGSLVNLLVALWPTRPTRREEGAGRFQDQVRVLEQETTPIHGVGPVTFQRREDGEVLFDLEGPRNNWITAGAVTRQGYLELTKQQLLSGREVWCPELVDEVRRQLAVEAATRDESGREIRAVVSNGEVFTFVLQDDGTISVERDPGLQPENALQGLKAHLDAELAPMLLTKLQLRRGEPVWYPDLEEQGRSELSRDGFVVPTAD